MERFPRRVLTALAALLVLGVVAIATGWLPRASAGRVRSRAIGPLVVLSPVTGKVAAAAPAFAPANASVSSIVGDGRGGWWIGGTFGQVGGFRCPYIVHLLADLKVDQTWCPHANNSVYDVVATDPALFVSGGFTQIGNARRKFLAAIDTRTGRVLPWNPHVDNGVGGMGLVGQTLYFEGYFNHVGHQARFALGAVDIRTGAATAWDPEPDTNQHGDSVNWIAVDGRLVFVSGLFSHIGGAARDGFAALDANRGKAASFSVTGGIDPVVGKGRLYVGLRQGGTLVFDLRSLRREGRWARRLGEIFSADSRFAYGSFAYSSSSFQCPCSGGSDREQVVGLDPATGAIRWRSPLFSHPYNPYGGSSQVSLSFTVASSRSYVLVGGNFQRVQD
jgi:PQQ-like domain